MADVKIKSLNIDIPLIMQQIDENGGINLKGAAIGDGTFELRCHYCYPFR